MNRPDFARRRFPRQKGPARRRSINLEPWLEYLGVASCRVA